VKVEPSSAAARRSSISSQAGRCTWVLHPGTGWPRQSRTLPRRFQGIWSSIALSGIHGSHGVCRTRGIVTSGHGICGSGTADGEVRTDRFLVAQRAVTFLHDFLDAVGRVLHSGSSPSRPLDSLANGTSVWFLTPPELHENFNKNRVLIIFALQATARTL
jgi:hypothetical protein